MRITVVLLIALLLPLAGTVTPLAAQSHAKATALDPVGIYDLDLEMHGQTTSSVLIIKREKDGRLTGTLEVHEQAISFETVVLEGKELQLSTGSELSLTLTFKNDDNAVAGQWTRPDASGGVSGVRRKS
ncbi:MAG TPA: hypothetical protein VGA78_07220 [Gemmatimonadales bacterium]